ncbi:MAG: hypothetical protein R6U02_07590 [Alkalibacterium sp.]|uniref:hypothetical protein n=1 Tax=Alkalibacterium sp. TaxID=1872447 RepID=UPI003970B4A7
MKFIVAHQEVNDMVVAIEELLQSGAYKRENLVIVCGEDRQSDIKSMVSVKIDTVNAAEFADSKQSTMRNHLLEGKNRHLYDEMISNGGYVLLEDDTVSSVETVKPVTNETDDHSKLENMHAPGFGVDFKEPKSDATNHEDNL